MSATWLVVGDEWHTRLWSRALLVWLLLQLDWLYWNVLRPLQDWHQIRVYRRALKHPRMR